MQGHPTTAHSFSDFNRGMQTRRYIKPTICSRDFLTTMSMDLRSEKEWSHHLANATGIDVSTIVELNLEFSNVQSTYGIGYLRSCQKLKLNNNIISRIIGMEHLKALKILDLSFNSIERIEGLEKCLELEELLLFHNIISKIGGVNTLKKLVILNLGCNQIELIQEVHALRHTPALRSLSLERNPVCKVPHYREQVMVWVSQVQCLDWKRILPPVRFNASEMFREKYRSFISKEKSEHKRRKTQELSEKNVGLIDQDGLFAAENGGNLYEFLNPSEEHLLLLISHIPESQIAYQSYRQQLLESGAKMAEKYLDLVQYAKRISTGFNGRIRRMVQNYAVCGKILVEGFVLGKYKYLETIKEEIETQEKEKLRQYFKLIDDVSHDLVKLLMQLELKVETLVKTDTDWLANRAAQEFDWLAKELKVLQQFEEYLFRWTDKPEGNEKWATILPEEKVNQIRQDLLQQDCPKDHAWLDGLTSSSLRTMMEDCLLGKSKKLSALEKTFQDRVNSESRSLATGLEDRQEEIYHSRMQEILDFAEQHKAEAFLARKRALARHGRQETDEDLNIGPDVRHAKKRRTKTPASTPACSQASHRVERLKKVEFESDEPLADYVVMKDIKDVVDRIAHIPLAERRRLFETRVVDVNDIADHVQVEDDQDATVFAENLEEFQAAADHKGPKT